MGLSYRIYSALGSGASGVGGGPSSIPTDVIVPSNLVSPYKGRGTRYIYRKYFLNITDFDDSTNVPVISSVSLNNVTASGVRVAWSVNQNTTTEVDYGTTPTYGSIASSGVSLASGNRFLDLSGLSNATTYYYRIVATNSNNIASAYISNFNTLDNVAPVISNLASSSIGTGSAVITWTTNEAASTYLVYGTGVAGSLTGNTTYDGTLTTAHTTSLSSLTPNTLYRYKAIGLDASSNSGESSIQSFTTLTNSGSPTLTITNIASGSITNSGAIITYLTSNQANTIVQYALSVTDLTGQSGSFLSYFSGVTTTGHTGALTNLTPGQTYFFKVASTDIYNQYVESPTTLTGYRFNTVDTVPPVIVFSGVTTTETSANVRFITNELSTGRVNYASTLHYITSGTLPSSVNEVSLVTGHSLAINSLSSFTSYTYQIRAGDSSGNITTDIVRNFVTTDTTAPVISNIITGGNTGQISVSWTTDEASTSILSLGTTSLYEIGTKTGNGGGYVTDHTVRFFNLSPSTHYLWRIASADISNNTGTQTGYVDTLALTAGPDVTPPNIFNVNSVPGSVSASVSWDTDEYSSTVVEYTASTYPGTFITGTSGTAGISGHVITIPSLPSSTTVYYKVQSTDASNNTTTLSGFSVTTLPGVSNSSFNVGDVVANVEFEIPSTWGQYTVAPVRVCVPVNDATDLVLPWSIGGFSIQREVIKRDANNNPKIVECIFPLYNNTVSAGEMWTGQIIAAEQETAYTWDQYELPSDLKLTFVMPDGQLATCSLTIPDNGIPPTQVRGNGTSNYQRTFKFYNRVRASTVNAAHPEAASAGVHIYVSYYNKNIFGSQYFPSIDIRISNAWIDETAPALRGAIYYQSMYIDHPRALIDGKPSKIINDAITHSMSFDSERIVLVKPMSQMPHNPHPTDNSAIWVGGSQSVYNQFYANDTSNHALLAGYALEFRLCLYDATFDQAGSTFYQNFAVNNAGLELLGFVYEDGSYDYRSWSVQRSFGPLNVRCPTLGSSYTFGGYQGRRGYDKMCQQIYNTIRDNLVRGTNNTYSSSNVNLMSPPIGTLDGQSTNYYPIEFGPYRPDGPTDGGMPGGTQITPFDGFNHSKYALLWKKEEHKFKMARHPHHMYSAASIFNDDGQPSSVKRWAQVYNGTNNTQLNGGNSIVGLVPFDFTLDFQMPYFKYYYAESNLGLAPWNAPTIPVTDAHLPGEGCSYHDDRTYYQPYYAQPTNNRYHIHDRYGVIDHAHQIRYTSNLILLAEMANDLLMKDDLIMQAEANMLSFSHYPTTNLYYSNGYNLIDIYYGYTKLNASYSAPGVIANKNQGIGFGRVAGWPLFATVAAYTLGSDSFRQYAGENIVLWGKILRDSVLPIGSYTRMYNPTILIQHPGLYHNGIELHLSTTPYPLIANYSYATVNSPGLSTTTTLVKASDGDKLVGQWTISNTTDSSAADPYSLSLTNSIGWGLILKKDDWLLGQFVSKIWGNTNTGSFQYVLKVYTINSFTGVETLISDSSTAVSPIINATALQLNTWATKQINPANSQWESFNIQYNAGYDRLAFKLYVRTSSASNITVTTKFGSISGTDNRSRIATTLQNLYGCIYDHAQVFETHILNMAAYAAASNVLKYLETSCSDSIFLNLRKFYNNFYTMTPDNPSTPGWTPNASAWLNNGSSAADSWVIGVAYNSNYTAQGSQGPLPSLINAAGRYSNERPEDRDGAQYAPWSIFIGMLAEEELGYDFINTVTTTPNTEGFLLGKWCQMSLSHNGTNAPLIHRNYIENQSANSSSGPLYITNAAGCIGNINWRENVPLSAPISNSGSYVSNIRVFIANENNPTRVQLAATPNALDSMSGGSILDASQTGAIWISNGDLVDAPSFRRARGLTESVLLYNRSGELGGSVPLGTSTNDSIPFWVKIRLDENISNPTGFIQFGVNASR